MVRKQTQCRNDYSCAIKQIERSQKVMQSIIEDETIDYIREKAMKYKLLMKNRAQSNDNNFQNNVAINQLKISYNKYKQYNSHALKKKKAEAFIGECVNNCNSTMHKKCSLESEPNEKQNVNEANNTVPQDRVLPDVIGTDT